MLMRNASAVGLIREARAQERAAQFSEAIGRYEAAIMIAEATGERDVLSEALRRKSVLQHQRGENAAARSSCRRAYNVACELGNDDLAAEALNTMGVMDMVVGRLDDARETYLAALALGSSSHHLRARVDQNLGILANIQGRFAEAHERYRRSLGAYDACGDEHGCALAHHNLGMVSASQGLYDAAAMSFERSHAIAERVGDVHLRGLCLVNHGEVDVRRQRFDEARAKAEEALQLFDKLGVENFKSYAYRVLGMVYRETGKPELANARLRSAIDLAQRADFVHGAAEAYRELALLYQTIGQSPEALRYLYVSYGLFSRLDAQVALIHVDGKVAELEDTYRNIVRQWGQSIERADPYTFGRCGRIARWAVMMARRLGLDRDDETAVFLGAYLHDLGKLEIPHEILNKAGPLTSTEQALVRRHPIWGVEMLADIDFPWAIKPIIRWHHERVDGTGYPDGLRGDDIPLAAQIVGILDLYDELTATRPGRPAISALEAIAEITNVRATWTDRVFDAFLATAVEPVDQNQLV